MQIDIFPDTDEHFNSNVIYQKDKISYSPYRQRIYNCHPKHNGVLSIARQGHYNDCDKLE